MQQLKSEDFKAENFKMGRHDPAIAEDAAGRLYDAAGREFVARMPGDEHDHKVFEAIGALHTATHRLHNLMERWSSKHGLTEGRMRVLFVLRFGPRTLGDLAERMRVSPRNITGLVDGLEGDGLVERVPDPGDRRAVHAHLTELGAKKVAEVGDQMLQARRSIAAGFTDDELVELRHLCLKLFQNVEQIEKEPEG